MKEFKSIETQTLECEVNPTKPSKKAIEYYTLHYDRIVYSEASKHDITKMVQVLHNIIHKHINNEKNNME